MADAIRTGLIGVGTHGGKLFRLQLQLTEAVFPEVQVQ